ncbi:hypothetical protein UNSWDHB_2520 [Dehalobacter sp. UNSWDHB]|nr:hypothetical protein DHBDCA_p1724 [Dehalobacter sp. DCA]AFV05735.1 hypothetical protein DCF50_p1733 [Dehalobacter sp. CF]EQB20156.1 hypothetical protein UNSWDHB_2520 [Dehalobacter sp. UNSWDHB]
MNFKKFDILFKCHNNFDNDYRIHIINITFIAQNVNSYLPIQVLRFLS